MSSFLSKTIGLVILSALFISVNIHGQKGMLRFGQLSTEHGLSHNSVNCFLQDSKGYLWIGTFDGLNLYNGYEIEEFKEIRDDTTSLSNTYIESIFEDNQGTIWVGTLNGINKYDRNTKTFNRYMPGNHGIDIHEALMIKDIYQDKDENMLFATYGQGLLKYFYKKNKFEHYKDLSELSENKGNYINEIFEDHNGVIWLATWNSGLIKMDNNNRFSTFILPYNDKNKNEVNTINTIFEYSGSELWLGTWSNGIYVFNKKNKEFKQLDLKTDIGTLINNSIIRSIIPYDTKTIFIGTFGNGLFVYKDDNEPEIVQYKHSNDNSSLGHNRVWELYQDKSGLIWIGTWGNGASKLDLLKNQFSIYTMNLHRKNWLTHNLITSVSEDEKENIWVGTLQGGLYVLDRNKEEFTQLINNKMPSTITCLSKNIENTIWIGTIGGLYSINTNNYKTKKFESGINGKQLSSENITYLYADKESNLWISCRGQITKLTVDKTIGKFKVDYIPDSVLHSVITIFQDRFGTLWFGTSGAGLINYNIDLNTFKTYNNEWYDCGLPNNHISDIYEDKKGDLWVGVMSGGLCKFNRETEKFECFNEKLGMSNDAVFGILDDNHNNLWVSTSYGISKYNKETQTFKNYFKNDGLHGNKFFVDIWGARAKCKNGDLIFGGQNGFTIINPNNFNDNNYIPKLVVTDLSINGEKIEIEDKTSNNLKLKHSIDELKEIVLSPDDVFFSIKFSVLHFSTPEMTQYAYKLENYDQDWIYIDAQTRKLSYTKLPPGEYVLKIKGSNNDRIWNDETSLEVKVKVLKPLWKRLWFIALCFIVLTTLSFLFYKTRMKSKNEKINLFEKLYEAEKLISEKEIIKLKHEHLNEKKLQGGKYDKLEIIKKNERLKAIRDYLAKIIPNASEKNKTKLKQLLSTIEKDLIREKDWERVDEKLDLSQNDFIKRISKTYPELTHKDIKIIGYIRLNYSNKEIAELLNISQRGFESARYRIRKKIGLPSEHNLNDYIIKF